MYLFVLVLVLWNFCVNGGVLQIEDQPSFRPGRIVNGDQVRDGDGVVTWQASIQVKYDDGSLAHHFCGGTLIENSWILTAAHCVDKPYINPGILSVVVNSTTMNGDNLKRIGVESIFIANYNKTTKQNDIALLKLKDPVFGTTGSPTVKLPSSKLKPSGDCTVSGYGHTASGGGVAASLMAANVTIIDNEECAEIFGTRYPILSGMICAGGQATDACQGDSGGPLVCGVVITGVVSWGIGCATPGVPGVYTNVAHYVDWINRTIAEN